MRRSVAAIAALLAVPAWGDEAPNAALTAPALAAPEPPTAGYQGHFFLRDANDWFVLFPKGRLQVDGFFFPARGDIAPGVMSNTADDKRPKSTIFLRRARAELMGTIAKHFDVFIGGEFATAPSGVQYSAVSDCFITVNYTPFAQLQVGQFDLPFTQENRTLDRSIDFMERSLAVRAFGVPQGKDLGAMVFGLLPRKIAYYSLGLFNGDGQNVKNQDNFFAVIGRGFVAPLAPWAKGRRWMEELEVGASG